MRLITDKEARSIEAYNMQEARSLEAYNMQRLYQTSQMHEFDLRNGWKPPLKLH